MNTEIKDLKLNSKISSVYLIKKFEIKVSKNGREYLDLDLSDKTGTVNAKFWDSYYDFKNYAEAGNIYRFDAEVGEFNGQKQLKLLNVRPVEEKDQYSLDDFIPKSTRPLEEMVAEYESRILKIKNEFLKRLLENILSGARLEKYKRVPAGKSWHHAYLHGLLEHTLEIVKICDLMCDIHPELNRDLLVCGAFLHDFGKTEELMDDATFDYTDKGKLLGHIVIAAMEIERSAKKIEWFPDELKNQLIHLVLSHQGKLEFASPVEPKTLEAAVLYHADELSAKANAYKGAIAKDETEKNWTKYLPLINTSLYKKRIDEESDSETLF